MIETPRLRLRTWRETDREPFAKLNADPRVMEFLGGPISRAESDGSIARIEEHFRQHGFGRFALEARENNDFVGAAGPAVMTFEHSFRPSIELGWRLAFEYWGKGLATEAVKAVLAYCGATLRLEEVVAFTVPANCRSRRVMDKCAMTHDFAADFDHPNLPQGHPLRRHVLYRSGSLI